MLWCFNSVCFLRSLRYDALTCWWSTISHVVRLPGGNKILHELKMRRWNSFRVSEAEDRGGMWVDEVWSINSIWSLFLCLCAEYIEQIKSGEENFETLASQFSDCSSAKNGGDLGLFGRGVYTTMILHTNLYTCTCIHLIMQPQYFIQQTIWLSHIRLHLHYRKLFKLELYVCDLLLK